MGSPENIALAARQVSVSAQLAMPMLTMLNFSRETRFVSGQCRKPGVIMLGADGLPQWGHTRGKTSSHRDFLRLWMRARASG